MSWLKNRIVLPLIGAFLVSILYAILLPLRVQPLVSFVVFLIAFGLTIEQMEKDTPVKRGFATIFKIFEAATFFLAYRIILGYIINLPALSNWGELFNKKAEGIALSQNWVLEIIILIIGFQLTKMTVFQKKTWIANAAILISFLFILWSVKQPRDAMATGYRIQAWRDKSASEKLAAGRHDEIIAYNNWAVVISEIQEGYASDDAETTFSLGALPKEGHIQENTVLRVADTGTKTVDSHVLVCISMPSVAHYGEPPRFPKLWVEAEKVQLLNAKKVTYVKGKYVLVNNDRIWDIYFMTDEVVTIDKTFSPRQQFMVSGVTQGKLKWPSVENPKILFDVPIGKPLKLDGNWGLGFKGESRMKITMRLL